MRRKKGETWKVLAESIYRRDRDDRLQQAFALIVPDLAREFVKEKRKREKIVSDRLNSRTEVKAKKISVKSVF